MQVYPIGEAPENGGVSTRGETLAKELNLEKSDFVLDDQPDAFRSGRAHQWLNGDLTGDIFFFFFQISFLIWDENHTLYPQEGMSEGDNEEKKKEKKKAD